MRMGWDTADGYSQYLQQREHLVNSLTMSSVLFGGLSDLSRPSVPPLEWKAIPSLSN